MLPQTCVVQIGILYTSLAMTIMFEDIHEQLSTSFIELAIPKHCWTKWHSLYTNMELWWGQYGVLWIWDNNIDWGEGEKNIVVDDP